MDNALYTVKVSMTDSLDGKWQDGVVLKIYPNSISIIDSRTKGLGLVDYRRSDVKRAEEGAGHGLIVLSGERRLYFTVREGANVYQYQIGVIVKQINNMLKNEELRRVMESRKPRLWKEFLKKVEDRKPKNEHYWRLLSESSNEAAKREKEQEYRLSYLRADFQNSIACILAGKVEEGVKKLWRVSEQYTSIEGENLSDSDYFGIWASKLIPENRTSSESLDVFFEMLENRIAGFIGLYGTKEIKNETEVVLFIKPTVQADENQGAKRAVEVEFTEWLSGISDILNYSKLWFLRGDLTIAWGAAAIGLMVLELFNKTVSERQALIEIKNSAGSGDSDEESQNEEEELIIHVLEKIKTFKLMFLILRELSGLILWNEFEDVEILLADLPEFFDGTVNPEGRKSSLMSFNDEIQWALIYFFTCQRLFGLLSKLTPVEGLRKFLG